MCIIGIILLNPNVKNTAYNIKNQKVNKLQTRKGLNLGVETTFHKETKIEQTQNDKIMLK